MLKNKFSIYLITISAEEADQRIDNFLRRYLKGVPRSMIYRIVRKGEVRVNKKRVKPKYKLQQNDEINLPSIYFFNKNKIASFTKPKINIAGLNDSVLYEDDDLLALNKKSGIGVHGGSGFIFGIIEKLRAFRTDARFLELVHRLDRDTSGVLLIAKKRSALRILHQQICIKGIQKDYLALVRGYWHSNVKKISAPLFKSTLSNGKRIVQVNSNGKLSETFFKVEERFTLATLVRINPITGRTHQIRVHAQYAGHPIAFDNRYGDKTFDVKLKDSGLNRLFLHAIALRFNHPNNGKTLTIEAPLDIKLSQCLSYLRNNYKYEVHHC